MYIHRHILDRIEKQLFKGKVFLLYGARRTGKTTLVKRLLSKVTDRSGYFNYDQQEIDFIEEADWELTCFEFKFNPKAKAKFPRVFKETYPASTFRVIHPDNFYDLMEMG